MFPSLRVKDLLLFLVVLVLIASIVLGIPLVYQYYLQHKDGILRIPTIEVDLEQLCQDWPDTHRPVDFPTSMYIYPYAAEAVQGSLTLVEDSDGSIWGAIIFSQIPMPPSEASPITPFESSKIAVKVDSVYAAYPEITITEGDITAWMAASYDRGVAIVIQMPSGDAFDAQISPVSAFALPCLQGS